jgi:hypothetical protein
LRFATIWIASASPAARSPSPKGAIRRPPLQRLLRRCCRDARRRRRTPALAEPSHGSPAAGAGGTASQIGYTSGRARASHKASNAGAAAGSESNAHRTPTRRSPTRGRLRSVIGERQSQRRGDALVGFVPTWKCRRALRGLSGFPLPAGAGAGAEWAPDFSGVIHLGSAGARSPIAFSAATATVPGLAKLRGFQDASPDRADRL